MNKYLLISILYILLLSKNSHYAHAQIFDVEQNPPGVKWMEIQHERFTLIYPRGIDSAARKVAATIAHSLLPAATPIGTQPKKITIILQNQGVVSNGFAQLAPRRSEFFAIPPQAFDVQDWLNSLAVHELRHVAQMDRMSGTLKAPFFEELALGLFGLHLPPWFFEGDAVVNETLLSRGGRGRLPEWERIFRTNTLSTPGFSYSKDYLGSLKDRTPGYYQMGYFMTTKLQRDLGSQIMDSIFREVARHPLRPYNLSRSIRRFTGMNTRELHDSTVRELRRLWQGQPAGKIYQAINSRSQSYPVDYLLPVRTENGLILAMKQSYAKAPAIVALHPDGKEEIVISTGLQSESNFSYANGLLVWDEFRYDARYHKRSYNVIAAYDMTRKAYRQLSYRSRLFSPALSTDGSRIIAVEVAHDNRSRLVILETHAGKRIQVLEGAGGHIFQTPAFNADASKAVAVGVGEQGSALFEFDLHKGTSKQLTPYWRELLGRPVYADREILFRAAFGGINNIYRLDGVGTISALTDAKYGASNASYHQGTGTVLFNNYQRPGYDISELPLSNDEENSSLQSSFIDFLAPVSAIQNISALLDYVPTIPFEPKPYRGFKRSFYFHSLSLIAEENEFSDNLNVGLRIKSDNQLNTLSVYAGYQYNTGLRKNEYRAGLSFRKYYPIFDLNYINRARYAAYRMNTSSGSVTTPLHWREDHIKLNMRIPFTRNWRNQFINAGINLSTSYTQRYNLSSRPEGFADHIRFPLIYQSYFNWATQRAARDLAPRWSFSLLASYEHVPLQTSFRGYLLSTQTAIHTPGLFINHSFRAAFNYQEARGVFQYSIDIPRVSGFSRLSPVGSLRNTLLLDYRLPLFYPDAEIGPLAYIKRVRAGFFSDFENIGKGNRFSPLSYGLELNADMNILRFYLPQVELSGKFIFLNEHPSKPMAFELGLNYQF